MVENKNLLFPGNDKIEERNHGLNLPTQQSRLPIGSDINAYKFIQFDENTISEGAKC